MTTKKIKTSDILGDNYYIYELTSSNYTPALNGTITITCTMKDVYGAVASSKSITLYQNGTSKGAKTTNSSGVATWSITCSTAGLQKFNIKDTSIEVFVDNKSNVDHTHSGYAAASALNTLSDTVNGLGQAIDELADVAETGDYGDLINAPTNISAFNNDVGYLTNHQSLNSKTVTVEKLATAESGYLSSYAVKQNGVQVGNTINIPKDFLVKSGSVKTVSTANNPVSGYKVGDKYIDLVINVKEGTDTDSHIYILVSDLVDTPVTISDVTGLQTALNGKANSTHTHTKSEISDFPSIPSKTSDLTNDGDGTNVFVKNNDSRLSDARTPTTHSHDISDVTDLQTTLNGKQSTLSVETTTITVTSPTSGNNYFSGGTREILARKYGKIVNVTINFYGVNSKQENTTTNTPIGTLPSGWTPAITQYGKCAFNNNDNIERASVMINTNGGISIRTGYATAITNVTYRASLTFIAS